MGDAGVKDRFELTAVCDVSNNGLAGPFGLVLDVHLDGAAINLVQVVCNVCCLSVEAAQMGGEVDEVAVQVRVGSYGFRIALEFAKEAKLVDCAAWHGLCFA